MDTPAKLRLHARVTVLTSHNRHHNNVDDDNNHMNVWSAEHPDLLVVDHHNTTTTSAHFHCGYDRWLVCVGEWAACFPRTLPSCAATTA